MAKKSHLSWHDIELYLKEKIGKRELVQKKDHYINELNEIKKDLVDKLIIDNDYSDLVIGNWGEFEILVDPYSVKDKIRLICNMYIDAIVK